MLASKQFYNKQTNNQTNNDIVCVLKHTQTAFCEVNPGFITGKEKGIMMPKLI